MEAVPRLPMISCELKISPTNTDFGPALLKYIREQYHEDPESYKKEVKELETLRLAACKPPRDYTGCSILKRYYSQLHFLQSRFPMTGDGPACVPFTWTDIYSQMVFSITDIEYEQACILYNIGALHSELGAMDSRINTEGMKIACTHFQCAAWAFQHLRDTYPQPKGSDMSHDLLTFFINVMLAQAQECILEKSMLDSRKSSITAKVAAQVVEYYRCAVGVLVSGSPSSDAGCISDVVGSVMCKDWKKFIDFKMAYYKSISHLYMGNQAEEQQKMGERVAWYQSASEILNEAIKVAKSLHRSELNEALTFTMDVIGGKHNNSKKENDFVYHEKVPAVESLPDLHRASLVKGIPFSHTDPDVCGQDIFARLVPMEAHESASLYSEEKAKILRSICSKIEDKNQELIAYMSSLQVDNSTFNLDDEPIPQELIERCAALSVRPTAVSDLNEVMKELSETANKVGEMIKTCFKLLDEETEKETEHQNICGSRRPSLIVIELSKESERYRDAHAKAFDSNYKLQSAVTSHVDSLKLLSQPLEDLEKMLPSLSSVKSPVHEKATKEFEQLLAKVNEMKQQRESLEQQLRDTLQKDDITEILITQSKKEDLQKTFQEELKKHDQLLMYLEQNLAAQDNILSLLTHANAQYAETRKTIVETKKERDAMIHSIMNSFDVYEDLKQKADKGLEFYKKLLSSVTRLLARVRSVINVQEEERDQICEAMLKTQAQQRDFSHGPDPKFKKGYTPKLGDYYPVLVPKSGSVPAGGMNYTQVSPSPIQNQLQQPSACVPNPSVEKTSLSSKTPDNNLKISAPVNYRKEVHAGENVEFSATDIRPPPVGSEATTVPEIYSTATSIVHSKASVDSLPTHQYYNSTMTSGSKYAPIYSSTPFAVSGRAQQMSSEYGIISQGFHSASVSPTTQLPARVTLPSHISSTVMNSTGASASNQITYANRYHMQSYPTGYTGVSPAPSQIYSQNLPSHAASVPSTTVIGSPYTRVTQANAFTGYPQNVAGAGMSYLTSGISGSSTFIPSTSSSPISEGYVTPSPTVSTQMKYGSYDMYRTPPVQGNTSTVGGSYLPTQYSVAGNSSNVVTSTSDYGYSVQSWTQMYPYSQQSPGLMSLPTAYPQAVQHPSGSSSTCPQAVQYQSGSSSTCPQAVQYPSGSTSTGPQAVQYPSGSTSTGPQAVQYPSGSTSTGPQAVQYPSGSTSTGPQAVQYPSGSTSTGPQSVQYPSGSTSTCPQAVQYPSGSTSTCPQAVQQPPGSSSAWSQPNQYSSMSDQQNYTMSWNQPTQDVSSVLQPVNVAANQIVGADTTVKPLNKKPDNVSLTNTNVVAPTKTEVLPKSVSVSQCDTTGSEKSVIPPKTSRFASSDSDLLCGASEVVPQRVDSKVLQPKVVDVLDVKSNAESKEKDKIIPPKDPLDDPVVREKFIAEVEKYEKFVDGLVRKSLNGTTPLDQKWKELTDAQDKESRKMSISIARCYPLKNRFPDIMPYDNNRVQLSMMKDDYINASYLKNIFPSSPVFVNTQAPLPATYADFWAMIWEQQVETLVCLLSSSELKNHVYWPKEKGQSMQFGVLTVVLQSQLEKISSMEYRISVTHNENRISRVVILLQFTTWPSSGVPNSPSQFLQFVMEVLNYHKQQRILQRPVVVHCSAGVGRSGVFCVVCAIVTELRTGHGPTDIIPVATRMSQQRKFLIQDKDQLKFCYDAVLYYAQDLLMKRGILTNRASFEDKIPGTGGTSSHSRHPSEDFILGSGGLAKLQSGIAKMGLSDETSNSTPGSDNSSNKEQKVVQSDAPSVSRTEDFTEDVTDTKLALDISDSVPEGSNLQLFEVVKHPCMETDVANPSITSILDPSNFTLETVSSSPVKRRITKESFANPTRSLTISSGDSADPLSQLDPLWSLKRSNT